MKLLKGVKLQKDSLPPHLSCSSRERNSLATISRVSVLSQTWEKLSLGAILKQQNFLETVGRQSIKQLVPSQRRLSQKASYPMAGFML